jgi:hypothetical protein
MQGSTHKDQQVRNDRQVRSVRYQQIRKISLLLKKGQQKSGIEQAGTIKKKN